MARWRPTNSVIVIARDAHAVPEPAFRLRDVEDKVQQLDDSYDDGYDDRHHGEDDAVVQHRNLVVRQSGAGVERHH